MDGIITNNDINDVIIFGKIIDEDEENTAKFISTLNNDKCLLYQNFQLLSRIQKTIFCNLIPPTHSKLKSFIIWCLPILNNNNNC